jgi:hypothetical protein
MQFDDPFSKLSTMWYIDKMFTSNEFTVVVPVLFFVFEGFNNGCILSVVMFLNLSDDVIVKSFNVKGMDTEVFGFQEDDVGVVRLSMIVILATREEICFGHLFAWLVV